MRARGLRVRGAQNISTRAGFKCILKKNQYLLKALQLLEEIFTCRYMLQTHRMNNKLTIYNKQVAKFFLTILGQSLLDIYAIAMRMNENKISLLWSV